MDMKPNVLLICVDHWPGRLLGAAGHPVVQTPTLDQLAANGVRFSQAYLDMYHDVEIDMPVSGEWAREPEALPWRLRKELLAPSMNDDQVRAARRAFYALCTHIDHQLRVVIGTLSQEHLLDNTVILFTSDHGDMLGDHGLWAKTKMLDGSVRVPMILCGAANDSRVGHHRVDTRLVGLQDIMPTLLDLAGVAIPPSVSGQSMIGERKREHFYSEIYENDYATRMICDERFKLVYYPVGNRFQLFDLIVDPHELRDLASSAPLAEKREQLMRVLIGHLYGSDMAWLEAGHLKGLPDKRAEPEPNRSLSGQRGGHWPPPLPKSVRQT